MICTLLCNSTLLKKISSDILPQHCYSKRSNTTPRWAVHKCYTKRGSVMWMGITPLYITDDTVWTCRTSPIAKPPKANENMQPSLLKTYPTRLIGHTMIIASYIWIKPLMEAFTFHRGNEHCNFAFMILKLIQIYMTFFIFNKLLNRLAF